MRKKKKLELAQWGEIHCSVQIQKCKKCGKGTEEIPAIGIVSLSMCKECKKFYGLQITDVTSLLSRDFKNKSLGLTQ